MVRITELPRVAELGQVTALLAGVIAALAAAVPPAAAATTAATSPADGAARAQAPPMARMVDYVALGDSYSSGVGTGVYDPASGNCARSPLSYPPLWASEHHPATFRFVACSGATTGDVRGSQITALDSSTDLVTVTIGGNDAGFGPVLRTCTVASSDNVCIAAVDAAEYFARSELPGRLARTYAAIRAAAPRARVIVLGYPRLFDLAPGCADPLAPNLARRTKLNEGADVIDNVIYKAVVQQPGFEFVDVRGRFDGHGVCSAEPWINGPSTPAAVGPYHPTQQGYRDGYLTALDATSAGDVAAA
ncbi:MAG: SGNH/GDSL hydrolase family protein [Pseudonocardiales bacterium]|nr:SGNH/GDSL hydrolase family protein [Pseudonocardiales bacterium]MBV9651325.1 SGNH/GDSL hydrolase family protein [Pseudonocardiales bacterium]